jgi:hypothetical protein
MDCSRQRMDMIPLGLLPTGLNEAVPKPSSVENLFKRTLDAHLGVTTAGTNGNISD